MPRAVPAVTGVLLAGVLALAAAGGAGPLLVVLLVGVGIVAAGWPELLGLPSARGSTAVVALGAAAALVVVAVTPAAPRLRYLAAVLALGVLAAFVHQLLRRDMRPRVVDGLSGVLSGLLVTVLAAGWIAAALERDGHRVVLVAAVAAAAGALGSAPLGGSAWRWLLAPVLAAAGAEVAALLVGGVHALGGAEFAPLAVGGAVGLLGALVHDVLAPLPSAVRTVPGLALGAAPVVAAGLIVEVAAHVLAS